ncbi:Phage tail collar domain containing protein [uncultured Caudovirales phage]|uniref:Phage tail collar domain containing protein n=1 Tax=uncultured Caudovirales phage TaxID=2100421 RepID=A0A6J7WTY2_9CAUD|nr:Phage tail collar domain containing protein [uncultured Caudovirales phage]
MSYLGYCPPAVVFPYSCSTAPEGWLMCNGAAVSRTTYASLFALFNASGLPYGAGDGSTTFNLPDYRGYFLRGMDNMGGTPAAAGRDTGRALGAAQAQATAKNGLSATTAGTNGTSSISGTVGGSDGAHTHTIDDPGFTSGVQNNATAAGSTGFYGRFNSTYPKASSSGSGHGHGFALTAAAQAWTGTVTIAAGDSETRPINNSCYYIIKI